MYAWPKPASVPNLLLEPVVPSTASVDWGPEEGCAQKGSAKGRGRDRGSGNPVLPQHGPSHTRSVPGEEAPGKQASRVYENMTMIPKSKEISKSKQRAAATSLGEKLL